MLYETLLQGKMFLVLLYFGLVCGIFLTIKKLICKTFKQNKILVIIGDVVFCVIASFVFLIAKNIFCYGEFRLFELLAFSLGIFVEQISINNLVEKILNLFYTLLVKIFCKIKKSKFGSKIFK